MDAFTEMAKLFKERENPKPFSVEVGKVISELPNIQISLGSEGKIVLTKENLLFTSQVLDGYKREVNIQYENGGAAKGNITFIDTLKNGDEVILIPTSNKQSYYLMDKVVRL